MLDDKNKRIAEQIKKLNEEKGSVSKDLIDYYKSTNELMNKILSVIDKPKDVPQIAKETLIDTKKVLWLLTAAVKYGKAEIIIPKSGYPKYCRK